jgi:chemotaxis response regulator CheB
MRSVRGPSSAGQPRGHVLAQNPATAAAGALPRAAIATGCVDVVLPLELIALLMATEWAPVRA